MTIEVLRAERERLLQRTDLTESQKIEIDELLKRAVSDLTEAETSQQAAVKFERERSGSQGEIEQVKAELAKPVESGVAVPPKSPSRNFVNTRNRPTQTSSLLIAATEDHGRTGRRSHRRRQAITAETAPVSNFFRRRTTALQTMAHPALPLDWPAELCGRTAAGSLQARRQLVQQQLQTLGAEIARSESRAELVKLQRELVTRQQAASEAIARQWREDVARAESRQAAQAAAAARRTEAESHPAVREIARRNAELLELLSGTPDGNPGLLANKAKAQSDRDAIERQLRLLAERSDREVRVGEASGLTELVDVRLRRMRGDLPNPAIHRQNIAKRRLDLSAPSSSWPMCSTSTTCSWTISRVCGR